MPESELIEQVSCRIPINCAGMRLDQVLAELLPDFSRSRLQHWIRSGDLQIDGRRVRPRDRVLGGELVSGALNLPTATEDQAQDIPLNIIFEDDEIIVLDKPAGLVTHPAAGNPNGTLVNALLHHASELASLPRAGLVHRLDKDTSGLLVVARTLRAHTELVRQLQARTIEREYEAVVNGIMVAGGTVNAPLGRHPVDRKRMAVVSNGKPAVTHYRVLQRFHAYTHLQVKLETGRTHQIRVHLTHIRHPLLGDPVYGGRARIPAGFSEQALQIITHFRRQALHAARLGLTHPGNGQQMVWNAPLPNDLQELLAILGDHRPLEIQ
ncbi:MAG: 23S rRNA pseudouridine(1911/1915/1917) synthase RluD [Candidatus Competibacteraceae bacterium]|jgi:23S rRNA pseudouridine1911/1915/1917 synthase|nr:23S rRNA pseudouridine(1911/1915/1917) synthase RluD [Candidatus Competibacteraceae bacterium]